MQGVIYEETSIFTFALVTIILGGGAAWLTGRALAITWRRYWQLLAYMLLLAAAVRFLHFALFEGTLLALRFYLVDLAFLVVFGTLGYMQTRASQMTTQYPWLYERASPLHWRSRKDAA
ncbi:DUF6867 family protein [Tepidamorphus sp. 3E244]|uniref:DUF6867 family protein n=1 Tax=Tepidamorphus sp. 3E244 TaxID=3385498 RepID=UPI0038FC541C